jgi:hypothetical protein
VDWIAKAVKTGKLSFQRDRIQRIPTLTVLFSRRALVSTPRLTRQGSAQPLTNDPCQHTNCTQIQTHTTRMSEKQGPSRVKDVGILAGVVGLRTVSHEDSE